MLTVLKKNLALTLLVLTLILGLQMIQINRPYRGHFASYQTVMASIARNMMRENFSDLLMPKTDVLMRGQRSLHLNQYPFPSLAAAVGAKLTGGSLEFWGRFQSIVFNLISILLTGLIAASVLGPSCGALAALLYALSPFSLIYGQCFMSEAMGVSFLLLSVYLLLGAEPSLSKIALSGFCLSVAAAGRIHLIFFYPLLALDLWKKSPAQKINRVLLFSAVSGILPLLWYAYTYVAGKGSDHLHTSLFLQLAGGSSKEVTPFLSPEYFKRLLDIVSQGMLTPLLFPFLGLGLFFWDRKKQEAFFLVLALVPGFFPALLFPSKIMAHDFYLYGAFPFVIIVSAYGLHTIFQSFPAMTRKVPAFLLTVLYFAVSARFSLHPVFNYPAEEKGVVEASEFAVSHTAPDDKLAVTGLSPATLLYYADRPAWSLELGMIGKSLPPYQKVMGLQDRKALEIQNDEEVMRDPVSWLEYLRAQGAAYLLVASRAELEKFPDFLDYVERNYQKISSEEKPFMLFSLKNGRL